MEKKLSNIHDKIKRELFNTKEFDTSGSNIPHINYKLKAIVRALYEHTE